MIVRLAILEALLDFGVFSVPFVIGVPADANCNDLKQNFSMRLPHCHFKKLTYGITGKTGYNFFFQNVVLK